jgi:hypothetical protein
MGCWSDGVLECWRGINCRVRFAHRSVPADLSQRRQDAKWDRNCRGNPLWLHFQCDRGEKLAARICASGARCAKRNVNFVGCFSRTGRSPNISRKACPERSRRERNARKEKCEVLHEGLVEHKVVGSLSNRNHRATETYWRSVWEKS